MYPSWIICCVFERIPTVICVNGYEIICCLAAKLDIARKAVQFLEVLNSAQIQISLNLDHFSSPLRSAIEVSIPKVSWEYIQTSLRLHHLKHYAGSARVQNWCSPCEVLIR